MKKVYYINMVWIINLILLVKILLMMDLKINKLIKSIKTTQNLCINILNRLIVKCMVN